MWFYSVSIFSPCCSLTVVMKQSICVCEILLKNFCVVCCPSWKTAPWWQILELQAHPFEALAKTMEKEMATHSSVLAWRIPGTGEPGGLPSMGSHRVGHDWSDLAAAAAKTNRLRKGVSFLCCVFFSFFLQIPIADYLKQSLLERDLEICV